MSTGKKVLNVFGIIIAWFLSIALVILLFVTPIVLSSLSLVKPRELCETIKDVDLSQIIELMELELPDEESQQVMELFRSDAVQELYEAYIDSVFAALDNDMPQVALDEAKIQQIVRDHMDELYSFALNAIPDMKDYPETEAKALLESYLINAFQEYAQEMPSGEEMRIELFGGEAEAQMALRLISQIDEIKLSYLGVLVFLSLLIFVCRLHGWRGFRWLSTNLFIAGGLNTFVCAALALGSSIIAGLLGSDPISGLVVNTLLPAFAQGVYIRTGIMIVSAIALLAIYLYIKKSAAKKPVSPAPETATESGLAE